MSVVECILQQKLYESLLALILHTVTILGRQLFLCPIGLLLLIGTRVHKFASIQSIWSTHRLVNLTVFSVSMYVYIQTYFSNRISPVIWVIENKTHTIQIPVADWDIGQTLQCRWASDSAGYDSECLDGCGNLPNATISAWWGISYAHKDIKLCCSNCNGSKVRFICERILFNNIYALDFIAVWRI